MTQLSKARAVSPASFVAIGSRGLILFLAAGIAAFATSYLWVDVSDFSFVEQRETYARLLTPVRLHVGAGILALIVGALQMFPSLRRRRQLHRALGFGYVAAVTLSALAGFTVARSAFGGASNTAAFWMLSGLWLYSTLHAIYCARRGNIERHRVWMYRSYALTFAAVTLRLQLGIFQYLTPLKFAESYLIVPWLSWIANLIVVEWAILPRLGIDSPPRARRAVSGTASPSA